MKMTAANAPKELLTASRLTGMDVLFDRIVDILVQGHQTDEAQGTLLRDRLFNFYPEFQRLYAGIFSRHLGREAGRTVLATFKSDGMQRYVSARQAMVPKFEHALAQLRTRMGETQI